MRVVWTPEAQQDRADVWDYIAADNPRAACNSILTSFRFPNRYARLRWLPFKPM